jgi:hypothetical protein
MINALELINDINDRMGYPQLTTIEDPTVTDEQRKVVNLLNSILKAIQGVDDWQLLRREANIVLIASEISSTTSGSEQYVTATQNSKTVTVDNMTFNDTYKSRAFKVSGDDYVYRIKDVLAPTQIELNRAWIADSITASDERTFKIAADQYALPDDFDRSSDGFESFLSPNKISPIDPTAFVEKRRGDAGISDGEPRYYTIYDMNDAQTAEIIHFHPYPKYARLLVFHYQRNHPVINSDNDTILYPVRYREFILHACVHIANREYEDDEKSQAELSEMIRNYNWQTKRSTETTPRMTPSGTIRKSFQDAYGFGGLRMNWGSAFDKAGNTDLE